MYKDIIKLEEIYSTASMEVIKQNLLNIKKDKLIKHRQNCKRNNKKVGKFILFDSLNISESAEKSYFTPAHKAQIPFITLIKICDLLNVKLEDITK